MPKFTKPSAISAIMFENVECDSKCSEALLSQLIDQLKNCATTDEAEAAYRSWQAGVDRSQFATDPIPVSLVGRLHFQRAFIDYLTAAIETNVGSDVVLRPAVEGTILHYMGEPTPLSRLEAERIYSAYIQSLPVYWRWVWLFLIDANVDQAEDLSPSSCLPWRLGLNPVSSNSTYVGMMFKASDIADARTPCVADVDFAYHAFWRPGGMTRPRDDCPASCAATSCAEIVASSPTVGQVQQFRRVVAR